jgi:hypothetical protein
VLLSLLLVAATVPMFRASAATALYPDLKSLPPRDLRFATATINGTTHKVLQFTNTVYDAGAGRLDMIGAIDPNTLSGPAYQRVYDDAGNYTQYAAGSFYWHAVHQHYHYDNWGKYELWTRADYNQWLATGRSQGQAKKVGAKTTSCIEDEEFIQELPGTPYPKRYSSDGCQLQPDNTLHEGLSIGWGDTYDWYRAEQWIDLDQTALADGTYVLRTVVDPANQIYESPGKSDSAKESQQDNEATTTFTVSGGVLRDGTAPTGTVTVNNTAASTSSAAVTVSALGRDDVSGVDSFRLTNDGTTFKSFSYTPNSSVPTAVSWSLTDPAYGGTSGTGTKTVYAQFHDASGKWGPTVTDTIGYGTGPTSPPSPPSTGYAGAVAGDGPVGYWRLGEASGSAAADAVGTHTGTYTGAQLGQASLIPTDTNTSIGLGGNGSVRMANAPDLQIGTPLSLEAWIRPSSLPANGSWASVVTKAESYSLQFNGPQLEFTVIQNSSRKRLKAPTGSIVAGQTYHVVGSYDGTTQRLYINGQQVTTAALTGAASSTTTPLVIGSWDGTKEFFSGRIDDVAVYPRALSATQVDDHYTAGTGGPPPTTTTVTAATTGSGAGTVTSSPAGISCPPTCSASFPSGSTVTLTAAASTGSTFTGWTAGACTGVVASCTFNAYAATTATASFGLVTSTTTYPAAVKADAPLGYWRLDDPSGTTAADAADGHPGTYLNGVLLGQGSLLASDADTAVGLDGVNDSVRVADAPDLQLASTFSLEAWIQPTALPASGSWASVLTKSESYSLQFNGPQLELTVIQGGVRKRLKAPVGAVVAGQTYHVVGTYDGTTQRLYLNGQQVASLALTGPASATTNPLQLGAWSSCSEFLSGRLDEVAVYGTVLSPARVKAHYDAGAAAS